jgi:type II secretion system (T2SS) protein F
MAEYVIKVADERGHQQQNIEHGFSEAEVRERYVQQGYLVYWVRPRGMLAGGQLQLPRRRKVKLDQFVIFNQQFLTLVKAGLPIMNALDLLVKRQKNPYFRQLLENVRDRVRSGELLSEAFAAQGSFPKIYTTTILAGEKSGNLEEVLGRYINFQRLAMSFRKKLAVSLVYPALLVVAVTVMLTFLVTYVVPQFAKLYEGLNATLPAPTVAMLAIGIAAQKYFVFILLGIAFLIFLAWRLANFGPPAVETSVTGRGLAEVPSGEFFAHDVYVVKRRSAAGSGTGNGRQFDGQPVFGSRPGSGIAACAGRQAALGQHRRPEDFSRDGGRDAGSRRVNGRAAGHAEFGGRVLRGRRTERVDRGLVADRTGDSDFHGGHCWVCSDFVVFADFLAGPGRHSLTLLYGIN